MHESAKGVSLGYHGHQVGRWEAQQFRETLQEHEDVRGCTDYRSDETCTPLMSSNHSRRIPPVFPVGSRHPLWPHCSVKNG